MEFVTIVILLGIAIVVFSGFAVIAYAIFLLGRAIFATLKTGKGFLAFLLIFTPIAPLAAIWFVMQVVNNLE